MPFIKRVKLVPKIGGATVEFDYLDKGLSDQFSSIHETRQEEIFEKTADAIKRMEELVTDKSNLDFFSFDGMPLAEIAKEDSSHE